MNYIEKFMKDNDIKIDEEFYVIDENGTKIGGLISIIFYFDKNMRLNMKLVESDCRDVFRLLMLGKCKIEKIPKKPKSVWDLKIGDEYWYITLLGYVEEVSYQSDDEDINIIKAGNAFLTKEEANHEAERRKCEAIMLKYGTRDMVSLGDKYTKKYYIQYDYDVNKIMIFKHYSIGIQGVINFKTEELAQKAIEEVGEDRLKKYIFNVKE